VRYCGLLFTLLLLLWVLLTRLSSGQSFFDEDVPELRCCADEDTGCCDRAEENWENEQESQTRQAVPYEDENEAPLRPYWISPRR
jgi:hypothetical protein